MSAMDLTTLKNRIKRGEEYLLALEDFQSWEWSKIWTEYSKQRLVLPQAMVLVHPAFYDDREAKVGQSIRVLGVSRPVPASTLRTAWQIRFGFQLVH